MGDLLISDNYFCRSAKVIDANQLCPIHIEPVAVSMPDLRGLGHDDAALFHVCAAASSFGVGSRIRVALTALGG